MNRREDLLDRARNTFPHPLADAIRSYQFEHDPLRRYEKLISATEKTVIWLGATGLAWAVSVSKVVEVGDEWLGSLESSGVSVGGWFTVACLAERSMAAAGEDLGGFQEALRARPKNKGPRGHLEMLINERNRRAHGSSPKTTAEAKARLHELEPPFVEIVEGLQFLGECHWLLPSRLRFRSAENDFNVTAFSLTGDHPTFPTTFFDSPTPVAENEIYLEAANDQRLSLSPFIIAADCEVCLEGEIFYPSKTGSKGIRLISFDKGHEYSDPELEMKLHMLWQKSPRSPIAESVLPMESPPSNGKWTWEDYSRWSPHTADKIAMVKRIASRIQEKAGWDAAKSKNQVSFRKNGRIVLQLQFWASTPRIYSPNIQEKPSHDPLPGLQGRHIEGAWVWDIPSDELLPMNLTPLIEAAEGSDTDGAAATDFADSEGQFESGMYEGYHVLKEFDYRANRFLLILKERGGLGAAKHLLRPQEQHSYGFLKLAEIGKLEWSVEAYVLRPQYRHLFSPEELNEARRRLRAADFDVDRWEERPWQN